MQIIILVLVGIVLAVTIFWQASLLLATVIGPPVVYSDRSAVIDCLKTAGAKKGDLVVDLGCGSARTLITAVKSINGKGIGVDRSFYCYLRSLMNIYLSGQKNNITVFCGDFKKAEKYLKDADIVYLYLYNSALEQIEDWLFDHIGEQTKVVSLAFYFQKHRPIAESSTINLGIETKIRLYTKEIAK